jgi:archaellum component FlaC
MTGNRFVLSSVAFGVSFGVTLGLSRGDFMQAIGHGSITFLSSQIGCLVVGRQPEEDSEQSLWRVEELRGHIRALQQRRAQAYDDLTQLTQERDRVTKSLQGMQGQVQQLQAKSDTLWQQKEALSWNLSQASPRRTMAELQGAEAQIRNSEAQLNTLEREEADLNRSLTATLSAKQRAEAQLTTTQSELNQLLAQVAEQKANKTQLLKDITTLAEQRQQLTQELTTIEAEIQSLDRYRLELGRLIQAAEPARQQVSSGSQSLQTAIDQLQGQIGSLHGELESLETQILDRRTQKENLDQEIDSLRTQKDRVEPKNVAHFADPWQTEIPTVSNGKTSGKNSNNLIADSSAPVELDFSQEPNLDPAWANFATLLPKYEVQALTAIARHASPGQRLKQIAEANHTMPELLIDAINERALETIGDILLEPSAQSGTPMIAQEYESSVQAILRAYDRTKKAQAEA